MIRRVAALLLGLTLAGLVPALASGVPVGSSTLDVYRSCVLTGVSSASTAVEDTWVSESSPTNNFGTTSSMDVRSRSSQNSRTYLRFDLTTCSPSIPTTATVVSAELDLFLTNRATSCQTVDVFRLNASWVETTITWNNQPIGTAINNPPSAQRSAFALIGAAPCTYSVANTYTSWELTADVQAFVSGAATNYGWMLRDDVENNSSQRLNRFASSEANRADRGPRLEITYRP